MSNSEITNQIEYYIQQAENLLIQLRQVQLRFGSPSTEVEKDFWGEVGGAFGEALFESTTAGRWGKKLTKGFLTQKQKQQLAFEEQRIEDAFSGLLSNLSLFFSSVSIKKSGLKPEGNSYLLSNRLLKANEAEKLETKIKKIIAVLKAIRNEPLIYNRDIPVLMEQTKIQVRSTLGRRMKRGKEGWNFIRYVFVFLLAVAVFIINNIPITWGYRMVIFSVALFVLFWLCFLNSKFQNKIILLKNNLEGI